MFDMVLNTLKGFTALFLALEHLKYCLNTQSLIGICVILWWFHCCFLLKFYLINYLESLYFPINTTSETMKCDLFKHKLFQKNSQKMWWAVVMCKMLDNSAPKMDFRHVLRCVCDHTFSHQAWGLVHITLFWFSSPKIEVYCSGLSYSEPTENFQKNLVGCLRWHANIS